ncbi:MAG: YkgJ family cysteine cluster protein [Pseudomonadota bacterium]
MNADFSAIFAKYERLLAEADALFTRVREMHPDCVTCTQGCSDCCHALFDLSLVEAMYLNAKFAENMDFGPQRSGILSRAGDADREAYKIKKRIYRESEAGRDAAELLDEAAHERIRCPLLGDEGTCEMYGFRPITCRLYGIPTAINGKAHTCGKTAFVQGKPYPTVALDKIQDRLAALSEEITTLAQSRFKELHKVYVPVSMALLTKYDATYLGIGPAKRES